MQDISPESPEARRKRFVKARAQFGKHVEKMGPGSRLFEVLKRVVVGVYTDGFIHAGNLAYLALLTLFPFIIVAAAVARILGQTEGGVNALVALLQTMPPEVADLVRKPIRDVLAARSGNLLWLGGLVGLWTTGSFIETIRDVIRRAYGVTYTRPFWEYRLGSIGLIVAAVMLVLVTFALSVFVAGIQQFVIDFLPQAGRLFFYLFRVAPALVLAGSLYLLFYTLTPKRYRQAGCPKWPGAIFVTVWWLTTTNLLPLVISNLGGYDLTYGSLAGVVISLFFFFLIGLGVVIGAELNAALAEPPEDSLKEPEQNE